MTKTSAFISKKDIIPLWSNLPFFIPAAIACYKGLWLYGALLAAAALVSLYYPHTDEVGLKRVATYKLMARKLPHLCPIRDSFAEKVLGRPENWFLSWQDAFKENQEIVKKLNDLRSKNQKANHLSLLRVADIIIWERQKQKDE